MHGSSEPLATIGAAGGFAALSRAAPVRKRRRSAGSAARPRSRFGAAHARRAFTVVELIVVIAVIALIITIGVPAFNSMTVQQRTSKTRQLLNGALTRTHVIAASDQNLTAVRFCPAQWQLDDQGAAIGAAGRQVMTTYSWRYTYAANPSDPTQVMFAERFERLENGPTQLLPPDTWVAPSEAFAVDTTRDRAYVRPGSTSTALLGDLVLQGTIGEFELNPADSGEQLLEADDFLIVFDPEIGVQRSTNGPVRNSWPMLAYDADAEIERDGQRASGGRLDRRLRFERYNFAGAVIYRREPFEALGPSADDPGTIDARRDALLRFGQTFHVNRTGGSLIAGETERPEEP